MSASIRLLLLNKFSKYKEEIFGGLTAAGLRYEGYEAMDKADFQKKLTEHKPNAIIMMGDLSQENPEAQIRYGEVQSWLAEQHLTIPIWLIIHLQDEPLAIEAMYKGVADYFFTDRLSRITPAVARLIGQGEPVVEPLDLNQIIEDYLTRHKTPLKDKGVELAFLPGADLPQVLGESGPLSQAVFSILKDAFDEVPSETNSNLRTYLDAVKSEVCLEIKLTGEALQKENDLKGWAKKEDSIDLMLAQEIVERHNGRIDIYQGQDAEMRICVFFPAILEREIKVSRC